MNEPEQVKTPDYFNWIGELKKRYRATQIKAAVAVNSALIEFYWYLGKDISERYPGRKRNVHFFDELSADLKVAIPESNGLSSRNLRYVCAFYEFYGSLACLQQVVANSKPAVAVPRLDVLLRIPWGHHVLILDKCKGDCEKALFYVRKTVENGWSRSVLALEISQDLYLGQLQGYVAACDLNARPKGGWHEGSVEVLRSCHRTRRRSGLGLRERPALRRRRREDRHRLPVRAADRLDGIRGGVRRPDLHIDGRLISGLAPIRISRATRFRSTRTWSICRSRRNGRRSR